MAGQVERIRVFLRVAELESFAEAARALGVSRSIVTRYVSELEADLGVQLLVRTTRQVSLTVAGQIYFDRTQPVIDALARARELVKQQHSSLSGELRISAPVSFGQMFLPDILHTFAATYPDVLLKIEMTDRFVDIIDDGYDMALRISGPPSGVSNIWRKIAVVPRLLVASPNYISQHGLPAHPNDLRAHRFLSYQHFAGGTALHLTHRQTGETLSANIAPSFVADSGELIVSLAAKDWGLALMPKFLVADELDAGRLQPVMQDWTAPEIWLTAFFPPYEELPEKVAVFTSFIEDMVAGNPDILS